MLTAEVELAGERLVMSPYRALFWPRMRWLLLSDAHLGKAAHLRKGGAAIPEGHDEQTLKRLDSVIETFRPERIVVLGDLFHSTMNAAWDRFTLWAASAPAPIHLVPGNHDILADHRYAKAGVHVCEERIEEGPFVLQHDHGELEERTTISGHVHPGIILSGQGRQRIRVPAFFISERRILLPAFGTPTGSYTVKPRPDDRVFASTGKEVLEVTGLFAPRG